MPKHTRPLSATARRGYITDAIETEKSTPDVFFNDVVHEEEAATSSLFCFC